MLIFLYLLNNAIFSEWMIIGVFKVWIFSLIKLIIFEIIKIIFEKKRFKNRDIFKLFLKSLLLTLFYLICIYILHFILPYFGIIFSLFYCGIFANIELWLQLPEHLENIYDSIIIESQTMHMDGDSESGSDSDSDQDSDSGQGSDSDQSSGSNQSLGSGFGQSPPESVTTHPDGPAEEDFSDESSEGPPSYMGENENLEEELAENQEMQEVLDEQMNIYEYYINNNGTYPENVDWDSDPGYVERIDDNLSTEARVAQGRDNLNFLRTMMEETRHEEARINTVLNGGHANDYSTDEASVENAFFENWSGDEEVLENSSENEEVSENSSEDEEVSENSSENEENSSSHEDLPKKDDHDSDKEDDSASSSLKRKRSNADLESSESKRRKV